MRVNSYQIMEPSFRHELKYVCSDADMKLIECKIRCICPKDPHASGTGTYRIRSMYFDSPDDKNYHENLNGYTDRAKYRIRIYDASDRIIKLEKKATVHGMKSKQWCSISKEQCEYLLQGQPIRDCGTEQTTLQTFLCERAEYGLMPKVIVEYQRTPYIHAIGNVRITFDRNVTSIPEGRFDFFSEQLPGRAVMEPGKHILEIKYDDQIPNFIMDYISTGTSLYRTSVSKYAICRQYGLN